MDAAQSWHKEALGQKVTAALKKNNFDALYVPTAAEAIEKILSFISKGASIGIGGSMTMRDLHIVSKIEEAGGIILDHNKVSDPAEKNAIRRKQLNCDCFLTSSNAVTIDGKLVNMDGTGNRVAAMIYGPKKVVVVVGLNKIVKNVEDAMARIELVASPQNNKRLNIPNPCTQTGVCMDCQGPTRICNVTTIMHRKPSATDLTVLVVGEELGY